ncbi:MAG: FtsX-like permease family protein [Gemmatimonas sp.]|nr:FtsX-like permease family protein [Gemmatimonas sp.]
MFVGRHLLQSSGRGTILPLVSAPPRQPIRAGKPVELDLELELRIPFLRPHRPNEAMATLLQDVRFALRGLIRRPGFTTIAVLTLALGIGANTAIFSVVRAVILRPLPFEEPNRLVRIQGTNLGTGERTNLSPADFFDLQRDSRTLTRMGAHGWIGPATVSDGAGRAERLGRVDVTEGFFATLGVRPAIGRLFTVEEDLPGADPAVVLSDGLWRRMFGNDPDIVGRTILLNAVPTTVVGILPAEFRHVEERTDRRAELFTPYRFDQADLNRGGHFIRAVGRLAPGTTVEQARSELATIAARLERDYPEDNTKRGAFVGSLHEDVVGESSVTLLVLLGAAAFVLLIACANLGNLLLAIGASRERELAVRAALGAGRGRLVRQLLTECLVLGLLGGLAGLMVAMMSTGVLQQLSSAGIPRASDIAVDMPVLAFATAIALVAAVAFGMIPALTLAGHKPAETIGRSGRSGASAVGSRSRFALITAEVALSVVLLVGAGLLIGTLLNLRGVSTGFEPSRAVGVEIAPPLARYPEGTQIPFHDAIAEGALAIPGVIGAGAINILPLTSNYDGRGFLIDDRPIPNAGEGPSAQARSVTEGYFEAMEIPLLRGRSFDRRDDTDAPLVVVISQSMAERYWPQEDPIGKRITFSAGVPDEEILEVCPQIDPFLCVGGPASREIIGIVGDVKHLDLREPEAVPMFYTPNHQPPSYHAMTWIVRTEGEPTSTIAAMRSMLAGLDPEVPLPQVQSLESVLSRSVAVPAVRAGVVGMFAGLAALLAWLGVYGVVGYLVSRRTHEIGVRLALGAPANRVLRMLAGDGLRPVLLGVAVGLPIALALSRFLEGMLFGVTHLHLGAYAIACGTLAAIGLVATLVPARRALRLNPAIALERD